MKYYITKDSALDDAVHLWLVPAGAVPPENKYGLWFRSGNEKVGSHQLFLEPPFSINPGEIKEVKIILQPGNYQIGIVREVDPFSEEIRSVMD